MKLTAKAVGAAKPKEKTYRLYDGGGMYLEVTPAGGTYWRMKYRMADKEKRLALGVYPAVSLAKARGKLKDAKELLEQGIDPVEVKKAKKAVVLSDTETFETVTKEWFGKFEDTWSPKVAKEIWRRLEMNVLPWLGPKQIKDVTAPEILAVVRRIESRGAVETARRQLQKIGQIMRYAVATGRAERDPSSDLKGAIASSPVKHFASIHHPKKVAELLQAIDAYTGTFVVNSALRLAPLVFVRPGELRHAEWVEFNLEDENPHWEIPAEKTKKRRPHIVPLSRQAVEILKGLYPLTGLGRYVFPGNRAGKVMSENTLNAALRYMGFPKDQMTAHGFRSMASTMLNEIGWDADVIEAQLAHVQGNKVRAAYNRAKYLPERRKMMQSWADFLDGLKRGAKVVPLNSMAG